MIAGHRVVRVQHAITLSVAQSLQSELVTLEYGEISLQEVVAVLRGELKRLVDEETTLEDENRLSFGDDVDDREMWGEGGSDNG